MPEPTSPFASIETDLLAAVAGGCRKGRRCGCSPKGSQTSISTTINTQISAPPPPPSPSSSVDVSVTA